MCDFDKNSAYTVTTSYVLAYLTYVYCVKKSSLLVTHLNVIHCFIRLIFMPKYETSIELHIMYLLPLNPLYNFCIKSSLLLALSRQQNFKIHICVRGSDCMVVDVL